MAHPRTEIRDAIVETLKAVLEPLEISVYAGWEVPLRAQGILRGVCVYCNSDTTKENSLNEFPRELQHIVNVKIDCFSNEADANAAADEITRLVENALAEDIELGGKSTDLRLKSTELEYSKDGGRIVCAAMMSYEADYTGIPVSGEFVWLNQVDSQFDLGEQDEDDMTEGKAVLNALGPEDI